MKTVILLCASVLAAQSAASLADPAPVRESVSYTDLDLGSTTGQQRLKNRISFAAYRLCLLDAPASPSPAIADPLCFRSAMKDALAQMERKVARANSNRLVATAAAAPSAQSR